MTELKFHCSMPIFVARQWIRHRTANVSEMSGRYSLMPMLFYAPPEDQLRPQSTANKQGRDTANTFDQVTRQSAYERWSDDRQLAVANYEWLTEHDFARELARIDLPLSTYTQWYWKIDMHNLLHFLSLRVDAHAQWEIQQFGKIMAGMLKRVAPITYEAWIDYEVCGARLSRMEMDALRSLLHVGDTGNKGDRFLGGLPKELHNLNFDGFEISGRERDELLAHFSGDGSPLPRPDFELDLSLAKTAEHFEAEAAAAVPHLPKTS